MKLAFSCMCLIAPFLIGCATQKDIPEATAEMAEEMGNKRSDLAMGRGIYMANCATCHERVKPGEIGPEYWRQVTPHMAEKADLSKEEHRQLLSYLVAANAEVHHIQ